MAIAVVERDTKGRVTKGVLNPKGRGGAGSKTAAQLADEALLRASGPELIAEAIRRALKKSDVLLIKLIERLVPPATRVADLSALPDVGKPSSASEAALACVGLLKSGELTVADLGALVTVFKALKETASDYKLDKEMEEMGL